MQLITVVQMPVHETCTFGKITHNILDKLGHMWYTYRKYPLI